MVFNADKFQVLLIDQRKQHHTNGAVQIVEQSIKIVPSVELFSIEIDDNLTVNLHINKICNSAVNQLNAMTFNVKETLIKSDFMSNFSYCPLVWIFLPTKSLRAELEICKNDLWDLFLFENYEYTYGQLLNKRSR